MGGSSKWDVQQVVIVVGIAVLHHRGVFVAARLAVLSGSGTRKRLNSRGSKMTYEGKFKTVIFGPNPFAAYFYGVERRCGPALYIKGASITCVPGELEEAVSVIVFVDQDNNRKTYKDRDRIFTDEHEMEVAKTVIFGPCWRCMARAKVGEVEEPVLYMVVNSKNMLPKNATHGANIIKEVKCGCRVTTHKDIRYPLSVLPLSDERIDEIVEQMYARFEETAWFKERVKKEENPRTTVGVHEELVSLYHVMSDSGHKPVRQFLPEFWKVIVMQHDLLYGDKGKGD
jgi:hypothetical protein